MTVLELGDGIAGAVAAAQLAAMGATVHKVVGEHRSVLDHEPRVPGAGALVVAVLDRAKVIHRVADAAVADDLVAAASVVIDDRVDGVGDPDRHVEDVGRRNRAVWVTISPFGLDGPRAPQPGGELVALASGGLLSTVTVEGEDVPVSPPGFLAMRATGHVAALAALHGLDRHRETAVPVHVDVSAQEAVVMVGALPECAHVLYRCPGRAGSGRYVAPSGAFPCRDGFVRIAAIENHQWAAMVRVLGTPAWTEGLEDRPARAEHAAFITERVGEWARELDKDTCAAMLQREGVPSTPVNGPDEILASAQFRHRDFIVEDEVEGVRMCVTAQPWVLDIEAPSHVAEWRPLSELRIAEFTHVLAAPIAGALVGAMGADVVRLEELDRLDLYRRTGPFADGVSGIERGAYFAIANHSKRSVAADETAAPTIARRLVDGTHVVLENVGARRLERLGVSPAEVRDCDPHVLVTRLSGFGSDGPLAGYRVYANNVQAYGGLAFLSRDRQGELARVGTVLADVLSAVVTATAMAAWWLGPRRSCGGTLDVSMAEVVATTVDEFVAEASAGSSRTLPVGCELAPFAPHGVYRTADDRWLALSVQSDDEWHRVGAALQQPDLARSEWSCAAARLDDRAGLDEILGGIVGTRLLPDLLDALVPAGVRGAEVLDGAALVADAHLRARGFFPRIDHPDPDLDDARLVGLGWRFVGEGPLPMGPPPGLGAATFPADHPERTWPS
ncbi:MAG: carnitine dehydratase [Actinobacteria bacterium]|nr:carnitine dehydratase [Actinomycetota bacterium]